MQEWNVDFSELSAFAESLRSMKGFEKYAKAAVRKIGKTLVDYIKPFTPVGTGKLLQGWDKRYVAVTKEANGYSIRLVNKVEYARAVNDGHISKNQYGGPYVVHDRIKIPTRPTYQIGSDTYYVYGHFFVEKGKESLIKSGEIESIVYALLKEWWATL